MHGAENVNKRKRIVKARRIHGSICLANCSSSIVIDLYWSVLGHVSDPCRQQSPMRAKIHDSTYRSNWSLIVIDRHWSLLTHTIRRIVSQRGSSYQDESFHEKMRELGHERKVACNFLAGTGALRLLEEYGSVTASAMRSFFGPKWRHEAEPSVFLVCAVCLPSVDTARMSSNSAVVPSDPLFTQVSFFGPFSRFRYCWISRVLCRCYMFLSAHTLCERLSRRLSPFLRLDGAS